ncbi:Cystine-binding periplasmic protein [Pseudomonas amygdali pv. sesami]|nr:Cystine-binding periplasmic protein [Pseudomonas amygdali pv. sesami]
MNISAIRRTFLFSALSLMLGTGIAGQAMAGEQLQKIKDSGTLNVGLEGTYPPFRASSPASKSSFPKRWPRNWA